MPTPPVGVVVPGSAAIGEGANALIPGTPIQGTVTLGRDAVWLHSDTPTIDVVARLAGQPSATFPRPTYDTAERPGAFGLTRYRGHDPYTMSLPLMLEREGRSIEGLIGDLEQMAERAPGSLEPPVVRVVGAGVPHSGLKWRVQLPDDVDRVQTNPGNGQRVRVWLTVTLIQHVTDTLLAETVRRGKAAKGLTKNRTTVRTGESTLYDVARRVYGDPFRAGDIAAANPGIRLGQRLRPGRTLRLP